MKMWLKLAEEPTAAPLFLVLDVELPLEEAELVDLVEEPLPEELTLKVEIPLAEPVPEDPIALRTEEQEDLVVADCKEAEPLKLHAELLPP